MGFLVVVYIFAWLALLGGSIEALSLIIPMTIGFVWYLNRESKVNNYDMSKVSTGKMAMDVGKSPDEIKNNLVAGKYDK